MVQFIKKRHVLLASVLASLGAWTTWAEGETDPVTPQGWVSPLTTEEWNWDDPANWYQGVINGVFGPELVGSGKTYPKILFREDTDLPNGLTIKYKNSEQYTTIRGDTSDVTLTLGDDVTVNVGGANKGNIAIGSPEINKNAHINLNGNRTFSLDNQSLSFFGRIYGGDLRVMGEAFQTENLVLKNNGAIDPSVNVTFENGRGLFIYEKDQNVAGCRRAGDIRLENGWLIYEGTSKGTGTEDSIGKLTLAPGFYSSGVAHFLNCTATGAQNAHLTIDEIVREENVLLEISSTTATMGVGDIGTKGSANVMVKGGVETIGSGAAGTPSVGIVPWARGNSGTAAWFVNFVTYDSERGFRFLDKTKEYFSLTAPFTGALESSADNVLVKGPGDIDLEGDNVVNSLGCLNSDTGGLHVYSTNGTLTVTSGAVDLTFGKDYSSFKGNLNFGTATAYITCNNGKKGSLSGTLSGADIVFGDNAQNSVSAKATFTASSKLLAANDLYINGGVLVGSPDLLPHGELKGRTVVNGKCQFASKDNYAVNGLYGRGIVRLENSYTINLNIGDNDADGDFEGKLVSTSGKLNVTKIGAGRQRFGGSVSIPTSAFHCSKGTVIVDGPLTASTLTLADGVSFGGKGSFEGPTTFEGNATLCVTPENGQLNLFTMNGLTIPEGGAITIKVADGKWKGSQCILKNSESLAGVKFVRSAGNRNYSRYRLSEDKTEVWLDAPTGFTLIIR